MSKTPSQLLNSLTLNQIRTTLIGILQSQQDPITDWNPGGTRLTQMQYVALALEQLLTQLFPKLAGSVYFGFASSSAWVDMVAQQIFDLTRRAPVLTQQTLKLDSTGVFGPYTIDNTFFIVSPLTGNRYNAISFGTLTQGSGPNSLLITVQAEGPNEPAKGKFYADGPNTLTKLARPWQGVTAANVPPTFSAVTTTPTPALGFGVVTLDDGPAVIPTAYDVRIVQSGQNTTAKYQYRINGGPWSTTATLAASVAIGPVTVLFANDPASSDPSFRAGDMYSFTSPGSPILLPGLAAETDQQLVTRSLERWIDLLAIPVDKHEVWAREATGDVKRVAVSLDSTYPGRWLVTIAGAGGAPALGAGVIAAVQAYIDTLEGICDLSLVDAATNVPVTATNDTGGQVTVLAAKRADVEAAANLAWTIYADGTDIGGTDGGVVRLAKLEQIIMDAGAIDVTKLLLNGVAANVVLGVGEVAVAVDLSSLNWVEV